MNTDERRRELRQEMTSHTDRALLRALPSWRTRFRRRAAATVAVAIGIAGIVLAHLARWDASVVLMFVAGAVPMVLLRVTTRGVADGGPRLDEHDRSLRDRAFRRAYPVAGVGALLLALYVGNTMALPDPAARIAGLLVALAWFSWVAPTLVLAWTLPDDDPADLS